MNFPNTESESDVSILYRAGRLSWRKKTKNQKTNKQKIKPEGNLLAMFLTATVFFISALRICQNL